MKSNQTIFDELIFLLHENDVLQHVILIGSWCLPIYKEYFGNPPEIPLLRTMDLDILVPREIQVSQPIDVPAILKSIGFDETFSSLSGDSKYVHPEMEVEFLIAEYGKGSTKPYNVTKLNVLAQGLRYLNLVYDYAIIVMYNGIPVRVPEPSVFVLLKYLVSTKRKEPGKKKKDLMTAKELGAFLITSDVQRSKLEAVFNAMHKKWQKELISVLKEERDPLLEVLL